MGLLGMGGTLPARTAVPLVPMWVSTQWPLHLNLGWLPGKGVSSPSWPVPSTCCFRSFKPLLAMALGAWWVAQHGCSGAGPQGPRCRPKHSWDFQGMHPGPPQGGAVGGSGTRAEPGRPFLGTAGGRGEAGRGADPWGPTVGKRWPKPGSQPRSRGEGRERGTRTSVPGPGPSSSTLKVPTWLGIKATGDVNSSCPAAS